MRLLNVHTLDFRIFDHGKRPLYAIASHRWRQGAEASLVDIREKRNTDDYGYRKIESFAAFVRDRVPGVEWLWVDTCCIDKSSSQEVQEAITTMYRWYEGAAVCLAYLEDVGDVNRKGLQGSVWFTRGWTLTELLAPRVVVFLSAEWEVIGHKGQDSGGDRLSSLPVGPRINPLIAKITNIPESIIARSELRKTVSVERKLGWMTGRRTTRAEDMAYSLLGIFEVSMPVIYNEGEVAAHRRLMQTIKEANQEEPRPSRTFNNSNYGGGTQNINTGDAHCSGTGSLHVYGGVGAIHQNPGKSV